MSGPAGRRPRSLWQRVVGSKCQRARARKGRLRPSGEWVIPARRLMSLRSRPCHDPRLTLRAFSLPVKGAGRGLPRNPARSSSYPPLAQVRNRPRNRGDSKQSSLHAGRWRTGWIQKPPGLPADEPNVVNIEVCPPITRSAAPRPFTAKSANKPRRSPCNVRTKTRIAVDSRLCYDSRLPGGVIWEISVQAIILIQRARYCHRQEKRLLLYSCQHSSGSCLFTCPTTI